VINCKSLLCKQLLKIFQNNKNLIFNNWISLVEYNVKIQDTFELDSLIELFKNILDNYINYFKDGNIELYLNYNIKITKKMACNDISYRHFMKAIPYFQESYIDILVKSLVVNDIGKCIILLDSNKHFNPKIINVFERIQGKFKLINLRINKKFNTINLMN